ncbi:MAG: Gfo/Idh/MocA family oxidoreductase [Candidatus Verstraetearchaeota archaeon]|nr:Gfo/Idh/MocA family oxidoreductase [Candidatus Verstraetearchaeota archaeon]
MKKKLNVAVIGCGFWGWNHLRVLNEIPDANLVAAADINSERLRVINARYNVKTYRDYKEMLEKESLDAVTICTPSNTHSKIALDVIHSNVHLLVEKPMTTTVKEAVEVVREAEKRGLKLLVGHIERYNPGVERVKKLIEEGRIGKPVLISSRRVSRWPIRIGDVGVIKDLAIHDFDIMRYLTGKEPTEIYAIAGSIHHKYEDYAHITLKFNGTPTAFIESNWLTPKKIRELNVTGSDGMITLNYITQEIKIADSEGTYIPSVKWNEPLKNELQHFVNSVLGREKPRVNGRDGAIAVYLCEAALRSASTGRPMKIKLPL